MILLTTEKAPLLGDSLQKKSEINIPLKNDCQLVNLIKFEINKVI